MAGAGAEPNTEHGEPIEDSNRSGNVDGPGHGGEEEPTTSTKEMPGAESVRRIKDMPELTDEHISSFRASVSDPERSAAFLSDKLGLKHFKTDAQQSILLDFSLYTLKFACGIALSGPQTRRVMKIANYLLDRIRQESSTSKDCEDFLKNALVSAVSAKPLKSDEHLTPEHIGMLGRFLVDLVMRNFNLWKYVLGQQQEHDYTEEEITVETPQVPTAFHSVVVTEEQWFGEIEKKKQAQEAERKRKVLEEQERQREAAQREQEEEKRKAEAEIQRLKEIKPATLDEAVSIQVKIRVEEERLRLLEDFQAREGELRAEIKEATSKLAQIAGEAEVGA